MYISKLRIINEFDGYVLQDINFHSGTNLIVDTENSERHNKVGKTTFLKIVDIALGAGNKNNIYVDPETNSIERKLEEYINENKSTVELTVVDCLDNPQTRTLFKVGLYKGGRYYIDNEKVNYKEYKSNLNRTFFDNNEKVPSFRQLISSFVRISMSGDANVSLRNLKMASNSDYRATYNFLFDISDPNIDKLRGDLQSNLRSIKDAEKEYKRIQGSRESAEIEQIIMTLTNEKNELEKKLNDIVSSEDFRQNRDKISNVRERYTEISNEIDEIKYKLQNNKKIIAEIIETQKESIDNELTKQFFDEVNSLVPDINKTFEDLVQFNDKLYENKLKYLHELNDKLLSKLETLEYDRRNLTKGNEVLISLVADDKLDEYNSLNRQLTKRNQEISQQRQLLDSIKRFENKKNNVFEQLDRINKKERVDTYSKKTELFNKYFTKYAEKINSERPILTYNPDISSFPMSITEITGTSNGTRKSLIVAYDLAYQMFAEEEHKKIPNFIIHDVLESIEGDSLQETINISNKIGCQYIVAILKEKLDSSGVSEEDQEKMKILGLSKGNRIFDDHRQDLAKEKNLVEKLSA